MDYFLNTTNDIISWFEGNAEVNEVGFGDTGEFDVTTITNFPYVFIIPTSLQPSGSLTTFTYQILVTDVIIDVYDSPLKALSRMADIIIQFAKDKGLDITIENLYSTNEVIYDQRGNRVYGWVFNYDVTVQTVVVC